MFRRLILAIFRLYMKYLLNSYTKLTWAVYMGREGVNWAREIVSVRRLGGVGYLSGPCCYQATSKLITVKSVVGIILFLCVCYVITDTGATYCTLYILYFTVITQHTQTQYDTYHSFNCNKFRRSLVTAWTAHVTHTAQPF